MSIRKGLRGSGLLKRIDFWAGIPLVALAGLGRRLVRLLHLRSREPPYRNPRNIGLLLPQAIGDMVIGTAIIRDLRTAYPAATITLFGAPTNAGIMPFVKGVDHVVVLPLTNLPRLISELRATTFDLLIDTSQWTRLTALICALSRASVTVGFNTPRQWRHFAYDITVPHRADRHELENFRALFQAMGIQTTALPELAHVQGTSTTLGLKPFTYLVLHAWPTGQQAHLKEWPVEHWVEIARHIADQNIPLVLTGGPADRERHAPLMRSLAAAGIPVHDFTGKLKLPDTIGLVAEAWAVLSVNTGIMHVAAALGVPVVGLCGPTSALRWGPIGTRAVAVRAKDPRCGYLNLGFEYPANPPDCMGCISVKDAWAALEPFIHTIPQAEAVASARQQ